MLDARAIDDATRRVPLGVSRLGTALMPNGYDVVAFFIVIRGLIALTHGVHEMRAPLVALDANPVTLDLWKLPDYALRTTLRMFAAMTLTGRAAYTFKSTCCPCPAVAGGGAETAASATMAATAFSPAIC